MNSTRNISVAAIILAVACSLTASAQVQDVEINPANPIQAVVNDGIHPSSCSKTLTLFSVPTGKRLVIETVHFASTVVTGGPEGGPVDNSASMSTTVGGVTAGYVIKFINDGTLPPLTGTQAVRIYADPGTKVTALFCQAPSKGSPGGGGSNITISGYLVTVP